MTRAPQSARCRLPRGAEIACSSESTVMPLSGRLMAGGNIASKQETPNDSHETRAAPGAAKVSSSQVDAIKPAVS
jgi:hypothetical protein